MHFSYPKKLHIAVICLLAILLAGLTGTLAWYGSTEAQLPQIGGSVTYMAKYFESGDGTGSPKYDPATMENSTGCAYEIKTAEQFYNLAWLQYLGYFNQPDENSVISTTYFYLSADLDMRNYVLPPVGTTKYPFLGNFDGNGHTISGLTVTNKVNNTDTPIKDLPYIITQGDANYEVADVEIIGLFGVVGALPNDTYTYSSQTNQIKNLYVDGITVRTQTDQALIGIAAGYVNGTVENVGVIGNTTIRIASVCLNENLTPNMSDFSLVGYCTEAYKVQNTTVTQNGSFDDNISGGGTGTEWGGTIGMNDLFDRLNIINDNDIVYPWNAQHNTYVTAEQRVVDSNGNPIKINVTGASSNISKNIKYYSLGVDGTYTLYRTSPLGSSSTRYLYGLGTTIANTTKTVTVVDEDGNQIGESTTEPTRRGRLCYFPINTEKDSEDKVTLNVASNNTGYFVSGCYSYQGNLRAFKYGISSMSAALNGATTYSDEKLQVITRTASSGVFCFIDDAYNTENPNSTLTNAVGNAIKPVDGDGGLGLKRYYYEQDGNAAGARVTMGDILSNGAGSVYGINFMEASIDSSRTVKVPVVSINGNTYHDYAMPECCVDFHLQEEGYITFFSAAIVNNSKPDSFFSLHQIVRDSNSTLTSIKQIKNIYQDADKSSGKTYIYEYSDGTFSAAKSDADPLVFALDWIMNPPIVTGAVYYFEIPVNAGEYALGSCVGKDSAFLMYLDIGANGDEGGGGGDAEPVVTTMSATATQYSYPLGVDFLAGKTGLNDIQNSAAIRLPNGTAGDTSFERENDTITVTSDAGNAPEASYIKDGITVLINSTAATATPVEETVYLKKVTQTTGGDTTVSIYKGANETEINDLVLSFTYTANGAPVSITYSLVMPGSTWNLVITASGADLTVTGVGTSGFAVTINGESVPGTAPPG